LVRKYHTIIHRYGSCDKAMSIGRYVAVLEDPRLLVNSDDELILDKFNLSGLNSFIRIDVLCEGSYDSGFRLHRGVNGVNPINDNDWTGTSESLLSFQRVLAFSGSKQSTWSFLQSIFILTC
jgi:hypothetical protein